MGPAPAASKLARPLAELLPNLALPPEALLPIGSAATAEEALLRLEQAGLLLDAVRLVASGLPRREAVWWASMCARHTAPPEAPPALAMLCTAAETWVRQQTDETRREAYARAQQAGLDTPEAWACVGAFWAGDSMAPSGLPKVPPAPHLTAVAVAGAVNLAAVRSDPLRRDARLSRFLASARDIASGGAGRLPSGGAAS